MEQSEPLIMASSNITVDAIASWNNASDMLNRYLPIFIYAFGITGNILNVLVLAQRPLCQNSSAVFFLVSSASSLIAIVSGLTTRMMAGFAADMTATVPWICKVRNYVLYTARTIALWSIATATVDRWLGSSVAVHRRRLSTLKNAIWISLSVVVFACVINMPIVYCYEANLTGALRGCYGYTFVCRAVTDLIYTVVTTLIPLLVMVSFGLLTIRNVRHTQNRVQHMGMFSLTQDHPITVPSTARAKPKKNKKMDKHLLKMLAVQVALLVVLTCPHAVQKSYTSLSGSSSSQSLQTAIENFIFNLVTLLNFTASSMPFYIYTLSGGSIFRKAIFQLLKPMLLKLVCR